MRVRGVRATAAHRKYPARCGLPAAWQAGWYNDPVTARRSLFGHKIFREEYSQSLLALCSRPPGWACWHNRFMWPPANLVINLWLAGL